LEYLDLIFYGNTVRSWILAALIAGAAFSILEALRALLVRHLGRFARSTSTHLDNAAVAALRATRHWFILLFSLGLGAQALTLPVGIHALLQRVVLLGFMLQLAIWGGNAIRAYVKEYSAARLEEDAASVTTVRALGFLLNVAFFAILFLMALDNFGVDITAMVAGLGIGGIAIALAVQNILGDLFASLSIVLDKPFVYGDFIIVDDLMGTVEHIGIKTTRLRSLSGEQLVFANSDLLKSRVRNFKRMYERRVVFEIGVTYQTPREKIEKVPEIIRAAVEALPDTRFDRSHFKEYGDFSLNFETVFFVLKPDFQTYMDRQQSINLQIHRDFEEFGIEFAYPTQMLYLARAGA
jgi:small-conductance mechanosensitive channel